MWSYIREEASHGRVKSLNLLHIYAILPFFTTDISMSYTCPTIGWRFLLTKDVKILVSCRKHLLILLHEKVASHLQLRGFHLEGWGMLWINRLTQLFELLSLLIWYQTFIWMYYRSGSISRGFRGEFRQWQIIPGICEGSPVMANQFSVKFYPLSYLIVVCCCSFASLERVLLMRWYYLFLLSVPTVFLLVHNHVNYASKKMLSNSFY